MVYIILGNGFEEAEAIIPCDLLRRAGVQVHFAGIGGLEISGGHGITVKADCTVEETDFSNAELIVLPGGLGGVASIRGSEKTLAAVKAQYEAGRCVAAICAAPVILAQLGVTDGKRATCYPGCEVEMGNAIMCDAPAITHGTVITGRAAGAAFDFGLELIKALRGVEVAQKIAAQVVFDKEKKNV